jgi:putative heme-binding domain-containing protein
VFRHPLEPVGAGFKAGQELFIKLPRPTDIDVDGLSRIYVASWRGASFTYAGPNVGYVIRVTHPDSPNPYVLDLKSATDEQLVGYLASPSQVYRLAAQRAILRRGNKAACTGPLGALARGDGSMATRVAALFTLAQLLGRESIPILVDLAGDPKLREFALIALSDRKEDAASIPSEPFLKGLADANPRVRLRAVNGLGRLGKSEAAGALVERTADPDPLVAHVAVKALVALEAANACLAALDKSYLTLGPGACRALQSMYREKVVDALIARLRWPYSTLAHPTMEFSALCRLAHREAEYTGDWWGTRPDTSGPYFRPVPWEQTERIERALGAALKRAGHSRDASLMLVDLVLNKVELKDMPEVKLDFTHVEPGVRSKVVEILATRKTLSDETAGFLERVALSDQEPAALRARAMAGLRRNRAAAIRVMAAIGNTEKAPAELLGAWREYVRDNEHAGRLSELRRLTEDDDPVRRELAYAVLLSLSANPRARGNARTEAGSLVDAAWGRPRQAASLLRAIGRTDSIAYALRVRARLADQDSGVRAAAAYAAGRLELDRDAGRDRGPTIASLPYETTLAEVMKAKGDARLGERLFQRQGCIACHTVAPGEPAKGPSLLGISARYSRAELIESILKPSAKIAQGFEPQRFATVDGRTFEGFVSRESGDEVEIRDAQGAAIVLPKKDIDERARGNVSVMPVGLVDPLTIPDFAALLGYLESLKAQ